MTYPFIHSFIETHLDGVERKLYDSALLRRERFGLLTDHVLLKASANKINGIMDHKDSTSGSVGGNYGDGGSTPTTTLLLLLPTCNTCKRSMYNI